MSERYGIFVFLLVTFPILADFLRLANAPESRSCVVIIAIEAGKSNARAIREIFMVL